MPVDHDRERGQHGHLHRRSRRRRPPAPLSRGRGSAAPRSARRPGRPWRARASSSVTPNPSRELGRVVRCRAGASPARRSPRRTVDRRCRRACGRRRSTLLMRHPLGLVGVDQPGVGRVAAEQLVVGAAVGDPAAVEVQHLVGQRDGGLAVGDHHQRGRAAAALAACAARMRASTSGSTAEVASSRTSSRGRRTSARASEIRCRWPPDSVVPRSPSRVSRPSRQRGDEAVGLGGAQRGPDLLVGDVGAQRDVAADGVVEEERGLRHQRRRRAASSPRARSRRSMPSTRIGAGVGVDQPGQQRGQGALAGGGGPDHGHRAAGLDGEVDVVEQPLVGLVGVAEVVDLEPGAGRSVEPSGSDASPYDRAAALVEHPLDPPEADHAARELAEQPADRADRERDDREQVGDGDHVAGVGRLPC